VKEDGVESGHRLKIYFNSDTFLLRYAEVLVYAEAYSGCKDVVSEGLFLLLSLGAAGLSRT